MTFFLVRPFLCFIYGIFSLGGQIPYFSTKSQYFHCSFCPEGGGQTPLPISMGGHGRICLPWIRHCQRAWYLSLCNVKYLLYNYCSVMVILYGPIFCCGMQNIDYATFPRCKT